MLPIVEPVDALWLVSVSASVLDFVSAFRRYADRQGIFIPTSAPLAAGKRGRIAITLADGQIMIEGDAEVVSSTARPGGLHGRAGMTLRFSDLDDDSRLVIAQLEKARFASKVTTVPDNVRARPARLPAGSPTPAINPDEKGIDPAQALALCLIVGNRDALSDSASRPRSITDTPSAAIKASTANTGSGKFMMPSIPSPGSTGRIAVIAGANKPAGETGATPAPSASSAAAPSASSAASPAIVAQPVVALSAASSATAAALPDATGGVVAAAGPHAPDAAPTSAIDELDMDDVVAVDEARSTDEMLAAPRVTVLSPLILPAREPAGAPPKPPLRKVNTAANLTLRNAAVPAPIHSVSPFVHADSAQTRGVVDDGEVTSTTEIPLPPHSATQPTPQPLPPVAAAPEPTFVGVVPPSGRATTADDLDETTSNSPAPTPDSAQQPSAAPSNLAVEVTPEAQAATADQAEQVLVNADMAPGASPSRRHDELNPVTGNWTIALTPAGPATIVREPLAPQFELAPSVRVGNAPLEISGAVGGRTDETAAHRPVGTSPSVEISAELAQPEMQPVPPIVPVQSLQSMMARMPPSSTPVGDTTAEVGNAAQSNGAVDPYGPTDSYQFGDLGQLPPPAIAPVAPPAPTSANPHFNQFATPAQGLASRAFGAQPAHHDPRALTDGGTGFFQSEESAANRPRYQTTGANISLPEPRSRRVLYMAAGAFAVIAIAIIVFVALGGTASTKSTNPTGNGGSAQPLGSGSDQSVTHVDDHGSANTNAVDAPVVDAGAEPTLDAAATTAVGVDAAIDEPVPTSTLCTLNLNSEPTGAEVVSDKLMLGVTPFSIDVACGQPLPLKFRKAKWISISKTLKPTRKGVSFTARLLKPALSIRVISTPPGANVTLNGKAAGVTPATIKLAPGAAATIAVVKKGFVPAVKKHTAKANNELVNFTLVKSRTR